MSRPVGRNTGELVPNDSTRYYVTMSLEQAVEPTGSCMVGLSGLHSMPRMPRQHQVRVTKGLSWPPRPYKFTSPSFLLAVLLSCDCLTSNSPQYLCLSHNPTPCQAEAKPKHRPAAQQWSNGLCFKDGEILRSEEGEGDRHLRQLGVSTGPPKYHHGTRRADVTQRGQKACGRLQQKRAPGFPDFERSRSVPPPALGTGAGSLGA
jgi:hypothetical protein